MGFLSREQLSEIGLKSFGDNVLISDKASFYSPGEITIGSNVRIDDFCIFSGNITLGNYIHISAYCALYGKFGIVMEDFTGLSPRCSLFSASDDFGGDYLISPMAPMEFTHVTGGTIYLRRFSQVGGGSIIFPDVTIAEGVAVGAMSLVKSNLEEWGIYAGIPAKKVKTRSKGLLNYIG